MIHQPAIKSPFTDSAEAARCRICFDKEIDDNNPLIRPCKCSGTIKWVHKLCIRKWRVMAENPMNAYKCLVCNQQYQVITTNVSRKLFYFYALPGLESLFYSFCLTYFIGYLFIPGEDASRADKAKCSPPFTPVREPDLRATHPLLKSYKFRSTNSQKLSWISTLKSSYRWKRLFVGQYMWSLMWCTSAQIGRVFTDRRSILFNMYVSWRFPRLMGYLFDYIVFDYAPILELPIQVLFTGKIFYDFTKLAKSIYDFLLAVYYRPTFLTDVSEVRDLNDIEA